MDLSATTCLLLAAMLFDAVIGDPRWLYRIVPHPTVVVGLVLSFCDGRFNRSSFGATAAASRERSRRWPSWYPSGRWAP